MQQSFLSSDDESEYDTEPKGTIELTASLPSIYSRYCPDRLRCLFHKQLESFLLPSIQLLEQPYRFETNLWTKLKFVWCT